MISSFLLIGSLAVTLGWLSIFIAVYTRARRIPSLSSDRDYPLPDPPPLVSVLIPARNEEKNIGPCIDSLLNSAYPSFEICVYDDRSTDHTREIIEKIAATNPRVRVVIGRNEPPSGWRGKPHAMVQLVEQAKPKGDLWLLTDADTIHDPQGLQRTVSFLLQNNLDMLSLGGRNREGSFWEKVVQPTMIILVATALNPHRSNISSKSGDAIALGQYILIRPQAYLGVGGHAAVYGTFTDDLHLAQLLRKKGFKIAMGRGQEIYSVRMYESLTQIVEGWTRYSFSILGNSLTKTLLRATLTLGLHLVPILFLFWSLWFGDLWIKLYGISQYLSYLAICCYLRSLIYGPIYYTPLSPLGNIVAVFILFRSAIHYKWDLPLTMKGRAFTQFVGKTPDTSDSFD